jgi:transcription initiation factor IIE alpha subunit
MQFMELEKVVKVWQVARSPTGYSITKLSNITGIKRSEVEKIVAKLKEEDFIEEKWRRGFTGWVSKGDLESLKRIYVIIQRLNGV